MTDNSHEIIYAIALKRCSHIGDVAFNLLLSHFGSCQKVWQASKADWQQIKGLKSNSFKEIGEQKHLDFAQKEFDYCQQNHIKVHLPQDANYYYPLLRQCDDAPALLYTKGHDLHHLRFISIVGTRNITAYGKKFIEDFVAYLADKPVAIVSGLALGVDAHAHQMALQYKIPTIGVLAYGFKQFYPAQNRALSEQMLAQGGQLMTEFPPSHQIVREQFIRRNRIIAGLSKLTVVVETAYGGGSISTVNFANQYNREVYALPGRFSDKYSQGCNHLINQNKARILTDFGQIIDDLGLNQKPKQPTLFDLMPNLSPEQEKIYLLIKQQANIPIENIINTGGFGMAKSMALLLELEMMDLIKPNSQKEYSLL